MAIENLRQEAIELRIHVQALADKIKDSYNKISTTSDIQDRPAKRYDPTAVIESLQRDQEGLQRRLDQFLSHSFNAIDDDEERLEVLKTSLKRFTREEKALSFRLQKLSRRSRASRHGNVGSYESLNVEGFVHTDEELDEEEVSRRGQIMSKKLKIIKFYYLHLFVFSSGHQGAFTNIPGLMLQLKEITSLLRSLVTNEPEDDRSNDDVDEPEEESESESERESESESNGGETIFKRGEEEFYLRQMGFRESDFDAKSFQEFERKIREFVQERRDLAEKARGDRKRTSFLERIERDGDDDESKRLGEIKKMAIQVGILLSLSLSGFLFVASESGGTVKQYRRYFKGLVKFLIDGDGNGGKYYGVVIEKVLSVLDSAEEELVKLGKLSQEALDDHDQSQDLEIDQVLDMFLREVLCLESVMSFPTLPSDLHDHEDNKALMNLQVGNLVDALMEGNKEIEKIGKKVHYMKTVQCGLIEESTDVAMARYREVMDAKIIQTWHELGKLVIDQTE